MKLGVLVESEEGLDWPHWRTTFEAAERLGFDSIWLSDHLQSPWDVSRHGLDPFIALSVAAAETTRLRFGTLVSPITFRQPAILARMAESLDALARGRFVLGLGIGWNRDEHERYGVPFAEARERVAALEDAVQRIRAMHGARRIPILLGGAGAATRALVRRYGDAWNVTTASAERFAALGAGLESLERSIAAGVLIGLDQADLRRRAERMRSSVQPLAEATDVLETALQMGWLVGTVDQIRGELTTLSRAGVDLAILGHYDLDDVAALELMAALQ